MSTVLFPVLLISLVLDWQGGIENPYFGFLFYLVLGPLFTLGVILILLGLFSIKSKEDIGPFTYEYLKEQFSKPGRFSRFRRLIYLTTFLTAFFLFIVGVTSYTGFQYTDSVGFCATFCHSVMEPEYVSYKNSPHSQVPCVDCHIGKSAEWLTKAKITGIKQLFSVVFESYDRPIKTPLQGLRPNRQACEECHRPEKFHGHKLYFVDTYLSDEANSHVQTVMIMKVGSGGHLGPDAHGIHWHTSAKHKVIYTHTDKERSNIIQVALVDESGGKTIFQKDAVERGAGTAGKEKEQVMDCIDCHNRPTHRFLSPHQAIDQKLFDNKIPKALPYIKQQALAAISKKYSGISAAKQGIADHIKDWYRNQYPEIYRKERKLIAKAIVGAQQAYAENLFHDMGIGWNTYQDHIGHQGNGGCFRCHNGSFKGPDGRMITKECNACHVVLAENMPADDVMRMLNRQYVKKAADDVEP